MHTEINLKFHLILFRVVGLWPTSKSSKSYIIWCAFFSLIVIIGFPISQIVCVFYVNSVNEAVDSLLLLCTAAFVPPKAFNVLFHVKQLTELLKLINEMDEKKFIGSTHFNVIKKRSSWITYSSACVYISACCCIAIQVIVSEPSKRFWSSTFFYPAEILHGQVIYVSGIFYQGFSNFIFVILCAAVDTYAVVLLIILNEYIRAIGNKLQSIGYKNQHLKFGKNEKELIVICQTYEDCLR